MILHPIDLAIVVAYALFALLVGVFLARRASTDVDQFFLSGRSLPWWLAGTSMVATTFAADTPLVITGWVRDHGIWKNWLWWSFAITTLSIVFLYSRLWRRTGVLTKAELTELRYGGRSAKALRACLGVMHTGVTNAIVLCWVLVAASKIVEVLFDIDKGWALTGACALALSYSLLAGFWGVVLTDMVQFVIAMVGSIALAVLGWRAIEGFSGLSAASVSLADFGADTLRFMPVPGAGSFFDLTFWTAPVAILAVNLGVGWWAAEAVDGDVLIVQRISACRDEKHGRLAVLWYAVSHYALRPWPWILVALASLVVLPHLVVESPIDGRVSSVGGGSVIVEPLDGGQPHELSLSPEGASADWHPLTSTTGLATGDEVTRGQVLARTDSERAYPVMMARYLPTGLLGLVVASLFAAFMSTIDTHVNLSASFFVNDLYRRFLKPDASATHYVAVARWASLVVMVVAGMMAYAADSISDLFTFLLAFLGGVGPVYVLRWLWWRVQAATEITAMITSAVVTSALSIIPVSWRLGPLSENGQLLHEGRLLIVVGCSLTAAMISMLISKRPEPESLVAFYKQVRPPGFWHPVRTLVSSENLPPAVSLRVAVVGVAGGLLLVYGLLFAIGHSLLGAPSTAVFSLAVAGAGAVAVRYALTR